MKRRRTKTQVDEDREEALLKEESLRVSDQQQKILTDRIAELEAAGQNNNSAVNILNNLLAQGIAVQDENGEIYVPSASKQKHQQ